jgi:hypothetical protein
MKPTKPQRARLKGLSVANERIVVDQAGRGWIRVNFPEVGRWRVIRTSAFTLYLPKRKSHG